MIVFLYPTDQVFRHGEFEHQMFVISLLFGFFDYKLHREI